MWRPGTFGIFLTEVDAANNYLKLDTSNGPLTGELTMSGNTIHGDVTGSAGDLVLKSNPEDDGEIRLGASLYIGADGSGIGATSWGPIKWPFGSMLYEQNARFFFLPNGDRWEVLNKAGDSFLFSVNGVNSAQPNRILFYKGMASGDYAATLPPTNGMIFSGSLGAGIASPLAPVHLKSTTTNTFVLIDGNTNFGSIGFRFGGTNKGYIGYSTTGGYITNSINNGMHFRGENGISFGKGVTKAFDVSGDALVWFGSAAAAAVGARAHFQAGTTTLAPIRLDSGANLTVALSGAIEYDNTPHFTNSDATRRHIVLAPNTTKVTAAAPYANDGYIVMSIGGTDFKIMTTA